MKTYIKTYESWKISELNFVGIHCSPKSLDNDDFYGKISDEYYMTFKQILELIQSDYPEAKTYLQQIELLDDNLSLQDDSIDLVYEIEDFLYKNNIEWIFVSKDEPLTKYGNNCYKVYFTNLSNVYSMQDELTDNSVIYIYDSKNIKPILKNIEQ